MNRIDILREVIIIANNERLKKMLEKEKEQKARSSVLAEYVSNLPISKEQMEQVIEKMGDLMEIAVECRIIGAMISESEEIIKILDEKEEEQPLS